MGQSDQTLEIAFIGAVEHGTAIMGESPVTKEAKYIQCLFRKRPLLAV